MPGASLFAYRKGARENGFGNGEIGIMENLMDSRSLFLTPNTETVYALSWLDLKEGPLVVKIPPNVLGIVDDFWFRYVADLGNAGPDHGCGRGEGGQGDAGALRSAKPHNRFPRKVSGGMVSTMMARPR